MNRTDNSGRVPVIGVVDERLKTTGLCLAVGYGARHDPRGQGGIAHLFEHLVMSAPMGSRRSFSERVESLGGHANATTRLEAMQFYAQVHADDADATVAELQQVLLEPTWTQDLLDSERSVVRQELAAAAADPSDTVQDAFFARLFPEHPLGRPVGGTVGELDGLTLDHLYAQHRRVLDDSPMTLVVVGPAIPASLGADVHAPGAAVASAAPPALVPLPPAPTGTDDLKPDGDFCWVCVGARAPRAGDPRGAAHTLLAKLLGSSPSSLLYRRLRTEKGLAYNFQAWSRGYAESGAWRFLAGVETANAGLLVDTVASALREVADAGPTEAGLAAARRQAEMGLLLSTESPLEYAQLIAQRTACGTVSWTLEEELARLRAVTAEDVRAAAAEVHAGLLAVVRPEAS
ncbi:hypothetical protein C3492_05370 [Streptomyces sp. Ru62]|nr:hypothetical protein C3492_05370 [Streptomyces sp. Ru62]